MRPVLLTALVLLSGCMTYARTKGAKPLERRQVELTLTPGVRLSESIPLRQQIPLPQGGLEMRIGVGGDTDIGVQYYALGAGFDVRHRMLHRDRWHLAVVPGFGAVVQPSQLSSSEIATFETRAPVILERELNPWLSVSVGAQLLLRQRLNLSPNGSLWRFEAAYGGGVRLEAKRGIVVFGTSVDVLDFSTRHTPRAVPVFGLDVRIRTRTKAEANARRERKGRPAKWDEEGERVTTQ